MSQIQLRGGYVTKDVRLDRLPSFDPRNLNYPATRGLTALPTIRKSWATQKTLDQGFEGACVGFAFAHEANAFPSQVKWVDEDFARLIYHNAQRLDEWEGGSYEGADPFYEGTSTLAGAKAAQALGLFDSYEWAYDVESLALAVSYKGPAVLGTDWYEGMLDAYLDNDYFISAVGEAVGGHAIEVLGVNPKQRYFILHNSWSAEWGFNGNARISWEDMDKLFKEGYADAVIPIGRKNIDRPV